MEKKYISSEEYRQKLVRDGDRRYGEWHRDFLDYQKKFIAEMSVHPLESEVAAQKTEPSKRVEKKPEKKLETPPRVAKAPSNPKQNRPSPQGVESQRSNPKQNRPLPQGVESEPSNPKQNKPLPQGVESEPSNPKQNGQRQENGPNNYLMS